MHARRLRPALYPAHRHLTPPSPRLSRHTCSAPSSPTTLAPGAPARDEFDHFGWGAAPELALRGGRSQAEFERELTLRAAFLREVVSAGGTSPPAFRAPLAP